MKNNKNERKIWIQKVILRKSRLIVKNITRKIFSYLTLIIIVLSPFELLSDNWDNFNNNYKIRIILINH